MLLIAASSNPASPLNPINPISPLNPDNMPIQSSGEQPVWWTFAAVFTAVMLLAIVLVAVFERRARRRQS